MKKNQILAFILVSAFTLFSSFAKANIFSLNVHSPNSIFLFSNNNNEALNNVLYEELALQNFGLQKDALDYAVEGYENLLQKGLVQNVQYLTIVDFSQPSNQKRFYLLDVQNHELVVNTYVMHGKKSGDDMAEYFSNEINSNQSSLGFYVTGQTYNGKRGYSLRLSGLEEGFNSNAEKRGVVVHGSKYINEERALAGKVDRSQGCPALPQADYAKVINLIKDGSVLFIYHPSQEYLEQSPVLNP